MNATGTTGGEINASAMTLTPAQVAEYQKMIAAKEARKEKQTEYNEHRRVWQNLMIKKAEAGGIKVTEAEVKKAIEEAKAKAKK